MVAPTLADALYAGAQVPDKLVFKPLVVGELGQLIVAHVHEGVPLVVACAVGTHPRRDGLAAAILHGLRQVEPVAGLAIQLHGAELHVVNPVVFLVDIRRDHRNRLRVARLVYAHLEGVSGLASNLLGKFRIKGLQDDGAEGEVARELACRACRAHRGIFVFATLLAFAVYEIHWALGVLAPSIVGGVIVWQLHGHVVAVVGNLVVELALLRIHAVEPGEAPVYLVHDVGYAVGSRRAVGLEAVGESRWVLHVGKHHLVYGVCRGGSVLQQVGGVVPSAAHVDVLPRLRWVVHYDGVFLVAKVLDVRVPATSLLAHIVEGEVGYATIHVTVDGEHL